MKLLSFLPKISLPKPVLIPLIILAVISVVSLAGFFYWSNQKLTVNNSTLLAAKADLEKELSQVKTDFEKLKNEDQRKRNETLQKEINDIQKTYQNSITAYEKILDLRDSKVNTTKLETQFAKIVKQLSERKFTDATSTLATLNKDIDTENNKLAQAAQATKQAEAAPVNNQPPSSGYRRQSVQASGGTFLVDIVSADLNSTRVIVDTASDSDCKDNCPVLSLADYVNRSGAYAGINGSFFCPATYPQCAGKTNSFDTLLMNKNKKYFNSDNNVYSTVPAVIFSGNSARFVSQSLEWGRDTGVDAVLANYPLLVLNGQSQFGGSSDSKLTSQGARCFVGTTGSTVYIGIVHNASSAQAAEVIKTLGIQNALGLDQGGSTALWSGGYKAGPGRGIPNALLFVKK